MKTRVALALALQLLDPRDRRLLLLAVLIQGMTTAFDLVGILLLGLVGALAVTTVQSQPPPALVQDVADALGLGDSSSQTLVILLASIAAIVLLAKSIINSFMTRRMLKFLANRQAIVSAKLSRELLSRPVTFLSKRSSQESAYALMNGAGAATSQLLGHATIAATELLLLVVIGVALLFVDPWIALGSIAFFAVIALALQRGIGNWAARISEQGARVDIKTLDSVQEAIGAYRVISVADRRSHYVERIQDLRWTAAGLTADNQFIGMIPKYVFEAALVVGGLALAGTLFATQDSVRAVAMLAVFLAAATRVLPSLMRLQGAVLGVRAAAGAAVPTFELAQDLASTRPVDGEVDRPELKPDRRPSIATFAASITAEDCVFRYPDADRPALDHVSLHVPAGTSLGLAGPSGAGKSTLADVILGVLALDSGSISIGGMDPREAVRSWPGSIAYVPQETVIANASVRQNVALGLPDDLIDESAVERALKSSHLWDQLLADGLTTESPLGEGGSRLSGGQRQRLGIARALYTEPRLLVLDEATSALDAQSELAITEMLDEQRGKLTIVVIAHRLSTLRHLDSIAYMSDGRLVAHGTFAEVSEKSTDFARQANLMGLS